MQQIPFIINGKAWNLVVCFCLWVRLFVLLHLTVFKGAGDVCSSYNLVVYVVLKVSWWVSFKLVPDGDARWQVFCSLSHVHRLDKTNGPTRLTTFIQGGNNSQPTTSLLPCGGLHILFTQTDILPLYLPPLARPGWNVLQYYHLWQGPGQHTCTHC